MIEVQFPCRKLAARNQDGGEEERNRSWSFVDKSDHRRWEPRGNAYCDDDGDDGDDGLDSDEVGDGYLEIDDQVLDLGL